MCQHLHYDKKMCPPLLDEDNAGKISLEVELVMPIWKFGSGLHLISILPKLLTNYADEGSI